LLKLVLDEINPTNQKMIYNKIIQGSTNISSSNTDINRLNISYKILPLLNKSNYHVRLDSLAK